MILFYSDWAKYSHAIVDLSTTNKSFIRLAGLYKKMGIKNHSFILALHNPELRGVDPYSEDITEEQIIMITDEVAENPWYYFREIMMAPSISGINPVRFRANRGNIALFWSFFVHITSMLIQPRQTGKSFSTDGLMNGILNFWTMNATINLLTKDIKLRTANVERVKNIEKEFPSYLQISNKKDLNNTETVTRHAVGNLYNTHIGQSSEKAAVNVGRGLTSPIFHIDEIAFMNNIEHTLPAALAAGGKLIAY